MDRSSDEETGREKQSTPLDTGRSIRANLVLLYPQQNWDISEGTPNDITIPEDTWEDRSLGKALGVKARGLEFKSLKHT